MEHVVFFPAPDGTPAFRRLADLDEAVRLVEHLRNVEGVSSASVHSLTEVPLAFRAYYRVEVPSVLDVPARVDALPVDALPVAEVPAFEVPAFEVPAFEVPAFEVPAFEVPVAEVPAFEVPAPALAAAVDGPRPDVPGVGAPAEHVPALALVEELPAEPEPEPAMARNGHATPTSLGFFA